jgi:hypothetical protein
VRGAVDRGRSSGHSRLPVGFQKSAAAVIWVNEAIRATRMIVYLEPPTIGPTAHCTKQHHSGHFPRPTHRPSYASDARPARRTDPRIRPGRMCPFTGWAVDVMPLSL